MKKQTKIVHTFKELADIAGSWTTVHIRNDYTLGASKFTITYNGQSATFENDNLKEVASAAHQFNGLSQRELFRFNP